MIRDDLALTVRCDDCPTALTDGGGGPPARYADYTSALAALEAAISADGWRRRADGRLLCRGCANESPCLLNGHDYRDRTRRGPDGPYLEDGSYGWRACACRRSVPDHADAPADPAGGDGCGMLWRLCGRCDHIEELHVTDDLSTFERVGTAGVLPAAGDAAREQAQGVARDSRGAGGR